MARYDTTRHDKGNESAQQPPKRRSRQRQQSNNNATSKPPPCCCSSAPPFVRPSLSFFISPLSSPDATTENTHIPYCTRPKQPCPPSINHHHPPPCPQSLAASPWPPPTAPHSLGRAAGGCLRFQCRDSRARSAAIPDGWCVMGKGRKECG
jgi:hypothetical protein